MPANSETLNVSVSLTWVKAIGVVVGIGASIGGPIMFACNNIRDSISAQERTALLIEKHIDKAEENFNVAVKERNDLDKRIFAIERKGGG